MTDAALLKRINAGEFDAVDFGCGAGASIEFVRKQLGYERVVGIELDPKKIARARSAGHVVLQADAATVTLARGAASASFLFHFLEHLPSPGVARAILRQACVVARDFVLIRQPFFGADEALLEQGLKLAWSTWASHANPMSTLTFHTLLRELQEQGVVKDFVINYAIPIESTADRQILPLAAPSEELFYDPAKHGAKLVAPLNGVYREVCVVARIGLEVPLAKIEQASRVERRVYPGR